MSKLDSWIDNKIVQNLFIWFCLFLILLGAINSGNKFLSALFIILLLAPVVYINNLFILPLFNKNKLHFFILFAICALVFTGISVFFLSRFIPQDISLTMLLNLLGITILALTFGCAIKISRDSFLRRQDEKEAELRLLKAQLNPHFLFNTLNNLYGLSVMKSEKLPNLMLKLSDLLRYSLYETKEAFVPLEKEIQYLENYMSLEKIRLEDKADIQFTKSGNLTSKKIVPMLLIVFVENAFKHLGVLKDGKSKVAISIQESNNKITFTSSNSIEKDNARLENLEKGKSGIGLENAKKRLTLLYPGMHQLAIEKSQNSYNVQLILDI